MKVSKWIRLTLGAVLCSGVIGVSAANAAICTDTTIEQVGVYPYLPGTVTYSLYATCNDSSPAWSGTVMFYIAKDDYAESLYAAALTSVANGSKSQVLVSTPAKYGVVRMLSVKPL